MIVRIAAPRSAVGARSAFTLLEMLVVVAIIVVLAGLGTIFVLPRLDEAKVSAAKVKMKELEKACGAYMINNGAYPANLLLLAERIEGRSPLIEPSLLHDPWGGEWGYSSEGQHHGGEKPDITFTHNGRVYGNWEN